MDENGCQGGKIWAKARKHQLLFIPDLKVGAIIFIPQLNGHFCPFAFIYSASLTRRK
jgi:hypothetical protein